MVLYGDYWYAVGGGLLIAIGSSFNLYMKGRISGVSGVFFGVITLNNFLWKISFLLGLWLSYSYFYTFINKDFFETPEVFTQGLSFAGFWICGFLVGFGTKMGNGCTSGHGVCGLPRFSIRSIVAVGTFLSFGVGLAILRHHVPFLYEQDFLIEVKEISSDTFHYAFFGVFNFFLLAIPIFFLLRKEMDKFYDYLISLATGIIMGTGIVISGMVKRQKVIAFLDFTHDDWDASLLLVLAAAVGLNLILFYFIIKKKEKPLFAEKLELPLKTQIDIPLVLGSAIFGAGWGIGGLCPGPLLINFILYIPHTLAFLATLIIGQISAFWVDKWIFEPKPSQLNQIAQNEKDMTPI